jgi:hypothetical protein
MKGEPFVPLKFVLPEQGHRHVLLQRSGGFELVLGGILWPARSPAQMIKLPSGSASDPDRRPMEFCHRKNRLGQTRECRW